MAHGERRQIISMLFSWSTHKISITILKKNKAFARGSLSLISQFHYNVLSPRF